MSTLVPFLKHLVSSYQKYTGEVLIKEQVNVREALDGVSFPILSHQTEEDPIINFANAKALELWETTLEEFTQIPSRLTAEAPIREEREQFLKEVRENGFTTGYEGIRVSRKGNRFLIKDAVVWNVLDEQGNRIGQAATFRSWKPI